ncbi:hypothetical protein [Limimaricola hongkongensis]|uniref:Uncharacterized protein n=1 Tax=Limimaricola hongkongensis DSM 17492 TaxID=1122180 RepID=A0A017HD40_9RHOB|nr:hypothetical protein [Limimaricola hongkongensis]EYD72417.1 hypothetical protein Lokhon_01216 [Limimaricola hongkongensis DSM 17492]
MKTIIGLGTALTIATAPFALQAEPRLGGQGGAVMQMLGAAISGDAKEVHKAERKLRKAARRAGVPVSLSTVAAAATGGAAARPTAQATPAPSACTAARGRASQASPRGVRDRPGH